LAKNPTPAARLPRFIGLDGPARARRRISRLALAVVGCGAVGRPFADAMARMDIGRLLLIDAGRYRVADVPHQGIASSEVGLPKAEATAASIRSRRPGVRVEAFDGRVESLDEDLFHGLDAVFLATDNLHAEADVSRRALHHRVPLIQGAVFGDAMLAQVRFLLNRDGQGPCLYCGFGPAELDHLARETVWSCRGPLRGQRLARVHTAPTMSYPALSATAAHLAASLLIRHALGLGEPLSDCVLEYCGYTNALVTSPLNRREDCPADHLAWEPRPVSVALEDATLPDLARLAGFRAGFDGGASGDALSFTIGDYTWVTRWLCGCAGAGTHARFWRTASRCPRCARCGKRVRPDPFACCRRASAHAFAPSCRQRPLRELGAADVGYALVRGPDRAVYLHTHARGEGHENR
jgi:molybdopterin/thiamine biosynthesis adenylyltransferase